MKQKLMFVVAFVKNCSQYFALSHVLIFLLRLGVKSPVTSPGFSNVMLTNGDSLIFSNGERYIRDDISTISRFVCQQATQESRVRAAKRTQ